MPMLTITRGFAAFFASLGLTGNLHAAEMFLLCKGTYLAGGKDTIYAIDPGANRWLTWDNQKLKWDDKPDEQCGAHRESIGTNARTGRRFAQSYGTVCTFGQTEMTRKYRAISDGQSEVAFVSIDRVSGKWIERLSMGNDFQVVSATGECALTKDPSKKPTPKTKF